MCKERIFWMDVTRSIAIILVLFTHAWDGVISSQHNLDLKQWLLYQSGHIVGRLGVPFFLFLSGSLILPNIADSDIIEFYKKRIPHFLVLTFIYFIATNIACSYIYDERTSVSTLLESIFYGNTLAAYQLWFMFSIIGLYFIAPYVSRILKSLTDNEIKILICLSALFINVPILISTIFKTNTFLTNIGRDFIGGNILYFLLGYLVCARGIFTNTSKLLLISAATFTFLFLLFIQYYLRSSNKLAGEGFTWYDSLLIVALSLFIFLLLSKLKPHPNAFVRNIFEYISRSSLCVFLFHIILLSYLWSHLSRFHLNVYISIISLVFLTYLSCVFYYFIIDRIKFLKEILL